MWWNFRHLLNSGVALESKTEYHVKPREAQIRYCSWRPLFLGTTRTACLGELSTCTVTVDDSLDISKCMLYTSMLVSYIYTAQGLEHKIYRCTATCRYLQCSNKCGSCQNDSLVLDGSQKNHPSCSWYWLLRKRTIRRRGGLILCNVDPHRDGMKAFGCPYAFLP